MNIYGEGEVFVSILRLSFHLTVFQLSLLSRSSASQNSALKEHKVSLSF